MKILFITSNRIGDAILSTGILDDLVKKYPEARFTIACGPLAAPLFEDFTLLDALIPFQRQGRFGHWWNLWCKARSTRWDIVVDVRGSMLSYALMAGQRYIWRSLKNSRKHRVVHLAEMLQLSTVPAPSLSISSKRKEAIENRLPPYKKLVAFAPAANWHGKEWPLSSFIELEKALTASGGLFQGASVLIVAAPQEYPRIESFINNVELSRRIILNHTTHLLDIAAALSKADFFIGNDSGLMHMAAALGVPTLGLFGPSLHELYAPFGSHAQFVRTDESHEELMTIHKRYPNKSLMGSITVEKVMYKIEEMKRSLDANG